MAESAVEVLYPAGGRTLRRAPRTRGAISTALYPASLVYDRALGVVRTRRAACRRPLEVSAVVVSVGNLEVGGNGKTPLAIHLVNGLSTRGHRPAYVSRGFGSEAERLGGVTVFWPGSSEPIRWPGAYVRLVREGAVAISDAIGDEGAVVAARCPLVPLAFSPDRREAIRAVCDMFEPTHVVLDDAFQTWSVPRDVDIVLLDAERPLGNGRTLPAGTLRERPAALRRAGAIGFNGLRPEDSLPGLAGWATGLVGRTVPVFGILRGLSIVDGRTGASAPATGGPAAVLSGIGRPSKFEQAVVDKGLEIRLALRYPDHFRYGCEDVQRIEERLSERRIERLVTTEKDWVKLREIGPPAVEVDVARLELEIIGDAPLLPCEKPQASPAVSPSNGSGGRRTRNEGG